MDNKEHLVGISNLKERITLVKSKPGKIRTEDIELVYKFSSQITSKEYLGGLIQAVILFGSVTREEREEDSDIDLLILINDVENTITSEMASAYSLTVGSLLAKLNAQEKLHLTTLGVLRFWDGVRNGDPVIMSLLRTGKPIVDTGFFTPLKKLLEKGLIKPTDEAVRAHLSMAKKLVNTTNGHIVASIADLYWAVMDSFHAYVMALGLEPVAPLKASALLKKLAKEHRIPQKYVTTLTELVSIMKLVTRGKKRVFTGLEYEKIKKDTSDFVDYFAKIIESLI
jgi:predicted nucleotidyltransferase